MNAPPMLQLVKAFAPHAEGRVFESRPLRPLSLKQVVTISVAVSVWMSRVPGDEVKKSDVPCRSR